MPLQPDHLPSLFETLGRTIYSKVTGHIGSGEGDEWCDEIMDQALKLGLAKREIYDPEIHGHNIDAEPGQDLIWTWGFLPEGWNTTQPPPKPLHPHLIPIADLLTYRWRAQLNGQFEPNGERKGITLDGAIEQADQPTDLYTAATSLIEALAQSCHEMKFPDGIQITLAPFPKPR